MLILELKIVILNRPLSARNVSLKALETLEYLSIYNGNFLNHHDRTL